jgi:hypothetical protein
MPIAGPYVAVGVVFFAAAARRFRQAFFVAALRTGSGARFIFLPAPRFVVVVDFAPRRVGVFEGFAMVDLFLTAG